MRGFCTESVRTSGVEQVASVFFYNGDGWSENGVERAAGVSNHLTPNQVYEAVTGETKNWSEMIVDDADQSVCGVDEMACFNEDSRMLTNTHVQP